MNRSPHGTSLGLAGESLAQLEFPAIVKTLAGRTQTPYGRQRALDLRPLWDHQEILEALQEAEESRSLLENEGPLPVGNGIDLKEHLAELHIDGLLLEPEFLREVRFAIEAAAACRTRLLASETTPRLTELTQQLTPLPDLAQDIRRCIGPRDEILDNASFELGDLRRQLQRERGRVKNQLERLLGSDDLQGVF